MAACPIVAFYEETGTDTWGQTLTEILAKDDDWLEHTLDWVQWVFPTVSAVYGNKYTPTISSTTKDAFYTNAKLREKLRTSLRRIERFFQFDNPDPWWLSPADHNLLRLARVLESLTTLGLPEEATNLYEKLLILAQNHPTKVPNTILLLWKDAAPSKLTHTTH